jgi:hypothetical protein
MTYIELLQLSEWITKRNEIVERDRNKCQNCLNQKYLYKTVVPFNILPYLDKTKIIIDEEPFEILVDNTLKEKNKREWKRINNLWLEVKNNHKFLK